MATDLQQLIEGAYDQSSALASWLGPLRDQAYTRWLSEANESADFLAQVLRNNPDRPLSQILARPDVQAALRTPFVDAAAFTEDRIGQAWNEGRNQGVSDARGELVGAGVGDPGEATVSTKLRAKLVSDARRNGRHAATRFRQAMSAPDPQQALERVARDYASRASLGVDAAGRYAHSEAKESMYRLAGKTFGKTIGKVWVTSFSPATCAMCASLHGTRRKLDEPFPVTKSFGAATLKSYGALNHPPRHPNCRCRVILFLPGFEGGIKGMVASAKSWWNKHK